VRLDEIPGVGHTAACVIIAAVGIDMSWFPTAAHPCSWARFAPGIKESAGCRRASVRPGTATAYLARVSARQRFRRARPTPSSGNATDASPAGAARRRPSSRSDAPSWSSSGNSSTTPKRASSISALTSYDTRLGTQRATRTHVRRLQELGYRVTLESAA
jgi:transposase